MKPKGTQFKQLQLFVDPEQHINEVESWDRHGSETKEGFWDRKEYESRGGSGSRSEGVYESVKEHGIVNAPHKGLSVPEVLFTGDQMVQQEGHHRIAAARAIQRETGKPQFVPLNYYDMSTYHG